MEFFTELFKDLFICYLVYLFWGYIEYRIARKIDITIKYEAFLIPFRQWGRICPYAGISEIWGIMPTALVIIGQHFQSDILFAAISLFYTITYSIIWGRIAERFGKNFWLWAIFSNFGIPLIFLAFNSDKPVNCLQSNNVIEY